MEFLDRQKELARLRKALSRNIPQVIVIYGRRRIGKSTLIKQLLDIGRGDIYFLADRTSESNQRQLFSTTVGRSISEFSLANYPSWEAVLSSLNRAVNHRITVCLDEFPYLVKSCPALPSILQKLIDSKSLNFDLILCGSSQQMMQGYVLDSREPLYGRANEIIRLRPIPASYITAALDCDETQAVREYAVWGGVPRYWELRRDQNGFYEALENLMLTPDGILYDEPSRLLQDEMRDTVQASSILSFIGNGAQKLSEIASRAERQATDITPQLSRLRELGLITKEVPFGENEKKSRKGLYHIADHLLNFHYRFVMPYRSLIELGNSQAAMQFFLHAENDFVGQTWEELCRQFVSGHAIDGVLYQLASRWWGNYYDDEKKRFLPAELDVVAESYDGKHLFVGECKWQEHVDVAQVYEKLRTIARGLPLAQKHELHLGLFLKVSPTHSAQPHVYLPSDILQGDGSIR